MRVLLVEDSDALRESLRTGRALAALEATKAPVLYVANVATQPGETDGYSLAEHVADLRPVDGP